ncbi:MAG TPA: TolC family protein [Oculatellaceae cyanobacterium]
MECTSWQRQAKSRNRFTILAGLTASLVCGPASAADDALAGHDYKKQLRAYSNEVRALGKVQPPELSSPIRIVDSNEATRQMPQLPTKSVQYSQLVGDTTLGSISVFQDNSLLMRSPKLSALISVERNLNPFSIDATLSQVVNLRDLLRVGVANNLDISVSRSDAKSAKYDYLSALGKFLPDISLGDQQYWFKGNISIPINNKPALIGLTGPFTIANAGFNYHVYQGGKVLFGSLQKKHQLNASNAKVHATYSDALTDIARRYYQLALEESLLQIRIRAADTSEEQVRVSTQRFEHGFGTNLDVLQARQQLAADRQSLLDQQVARRQSAIDLAAVLNSDMDTDLKPAATVDRKILVQHGRTIDSLVKLALSNRPEIKQLMEQRKAASSEIAVAGSALHPTVDFVGNVYGIGPDGGGHSNIDALYFLGLNINWKLGGLGTIDAANIASAKARTSSANVELKKKIVEVVQSVRGAYIKSLATDQNIVESDNRVAAAVEELRLAQIRYQTGVGTHLDVLTAQRDYTQAQITKAQAITNFNVAQVQLVRELGLVSIDNLAASKPIL